MYAAIMVPLDGSTWADAAIPVAVDLARRSGATLELVHVHAPLLHPSEALTFFPRGDDEEPSVRRAQLEAIAARVRETSGLTVVATFLTGPVVATLEAHVDARGPDLIVMTTHGLGGPSRFLLGSVADVLLRHTGVPVLLVRRVASAPDRADDDDRPLFQRVLIPLDGSERAEAVIVHAIALGDPDATEFVLVSVVVPLLVTGDRWADARPSIAREPVDVFVRHERETSAYLEQIAAELRRCGMTVTTRVVVHAQAARALLDVAVECHADVVAIATHGRPPLSRWVIGSVADRIVRGTDVPVLVFRATPAATRQPEPDDLPETTAEAHAAPAAS